MAKTKTEKKSSRLRSKVRSRDKLRGTTERPRICVFRSAKHTYAQIVCDETGKTLVSASTLDKDVLAELKGDGGKKPSTKSVSAAKSLGIVLGKKCKAQKIEKVLFDRNGFVYHGRVQAVADGAREAGLDF